MASITIDFGNDNVDQALVERMLKAIEQGKVQGISTKEDCPVPDPTETNKGKQILQIQQNISCRLESLERLMIQLQADMQFYSARSSEDIRRWIRDLAGTSDFYGVKEKWKEDTRRAISHLNLDSE